MANRSDVAVLSEGYRNLRVRIAGDLDSADLSLAPAITIAMCQNNDPMAGTLKGFRVNHIQYANSNSLTSILEWNAASPALIALLADANDQSYCESSGLQPDLLRSGADGSINLTTTGYIPGTRVGFSIMLDLVKIYSN